MDLPRFAPPPGLRTSFIQSALASKRPVASLWRRRGLDLEMFSTAEVLSCLDEAGIAVTLTGRWTPAPSAPSKGLVILIHGWAGCHSSSYLYAAACALHRAGFDVFRLNLRDHGNSHDLNRTMYHSAQLHEVITAIQVVESRHRNEGAPMFIVGYSQGGNFSLRLAVHGPSAGLCATRCLAVSPVMRPGAVLEAIDRGPRLIHRYYLDKWHAMLRAKDAAWPGTYDFARHYTLRSFQEITRAFVEDCTDFDRLEDYLSAYTVGASTLGGCTTPVSILTSTDDSVIPISDFHGCEDIEGLDLTVTRRGGHCGFIENYRLDGWAERWVCHQLERVTPPDGPRLGHRPA